MSIAVLGSGVIGLTTAILLKFKGYDVTIYTDSTKSKKSVSYKACALWMPFLMSDDNFVYEQEPDSRYWAEISWAYFNKIAKYRNNTGVFKITHEEFWISPPEDDPYYSDIVDNFKARHCNNNNFSFKWSMDTYAIDMSIYMMWLNKLFSGMGGKILEKENGWDYKNLKEQIIFNCLGISARKIFKDDSVRGIKGCLLLYPPIQKKYSMGDNEYCVIPRHDSLAIGSLMIDDESDGINQSDINHLINKTKKLKNTDLGKKLGINNLNVDDYKLVYGIRPYRTKGVRLEYEKISGKSIYHNYGHGGGGVTFSWGCSKDIIGLYEDSALRDLCLINKNRPFSNTSDVSIEIAHIELEDLRKCKAHAEKIIKKSVFIAKKIKTILTEHNVEYNTIVLIDDKSAGSETLSNTTIPEIIEKFKKLGVDYIVFESVLKKYSNKIIKILPKRYKERFSSPHKKLGCKEDILIWYSLRLGLIEFDSNDIKTLSNFKMHNPSPVISNRLISILPSNLKKVENEALNTIIKNFGDKVSGLCNTIYFDID